MTGIFPFPTPLGGELKPETEALVGPDALATLDRYNFNCGFWGSNGIAAEQGLTTPDIEEAQVKRTGDGLRGYPNGTDFSLNDPRVTEMDGCLVAVIE